MAHKNKVIHSINLDGDIICVDVFARLDGAYGFDEFRRDPEDGRGWYSIGHYGSLKFDSSDEALIEARHTVSWLNDVVSRR